jgi:predicted DNA-binding protein
MYACLAYNQGMKRTSIFLTDEQRRRLESLAKSSGMKTAELIRRFIDDGLDRAEKKARKKEDGR